jgi:hypothetical protein
MSYDIQDVLRSVQDGAPTPRTTTDDIIARAKRRRTGRTAMIAVGGVAACLAVAVAAATMPGNATVPAADLPPAVHPVSSGPVGPRPLDKPLPIKRVDFTTTLGSYRVGGYQVGPAGQVTAGYEEIPVYQDGDTWQDDNTTTDYPYAGAMITVYKPGVYDPGSFTFGEDTTLKIGPRYSVMVGDRPGIAVDMTYAQPGNESTKFVRTALAWQYQDGAWATLIPNYDHSSLPKDDVVRIAAGLVTDAPKQQLKVPFTFRSLPTGWQAVGVTQTPASLGTAQSAVLLHQGPLADPSTFLDESVPGTITVSVSKGQSKDQLVEGLNCFAGRQECTIKHGDYLIGVGSWDLSDATVKQIAQSIQLKNLADQNTWVAPSF